MELCFGNCQKLSRYSSFFWPKLFSDNFLKCLNPLGVMYSPVSLIVLTAYFQLIIQLFNSKTVDLIILVEPTVFFLASVKVCRLVIATLKSMN